MDSSVSQRVPHWAQTHVVRSARSDSSGTSFAAMNHPDGHRLSEAGVFLWNKTLQLIRLLRPWQELARLTAVRQTAPHCVSRFAVRKRGGDGRDITRRYFMVWSPDSVSIAI